MSSTITLPAALFYENRLSGAAIRVFAASLIDGRERWTIEALRDVTELQDASIRMAVSQLEKRGWATRQAVLVDNRPLAAWTFRMERSR